MGLFNRRQNANSSSPPTPPADLLPLLQIDQDKRYDIYCSVYGEVRVYEDVRIVARRQFEPITEFSSGYGGFLEVESASGSRVLIANFGIQMLCEHDVEPSYRVLRVWGNW